MERLEKVYYFILDEILQRYGGQAGDRKKQPQLRNEGKVNSINTIPHFILLQDRWAEVAEQQEQFKDEFFGSPLITLGEKTVFVLDEGTLVIKDAAEDKIEILFHCRRLTIQQVGENSWIDLSEVKLTCLAYQTWTSPQKVVEHAFVGIL